MEIGILIDLDSLDNFNVPEGKIDSAYSIAIFTKDMEKGERVKKLFNTDNVVVLDNCNDNYILEVAQDCCHTDKVFIVSRRIDSILTVDDINLITGKH